MGCHPAGLGSDEHPGPVISAQAASAGTALRFERSL